VHAKFAEKLLPRTRVDRIRSDRVPGFALWHHVLAAEGNNKAMTSTDPVRTDPGGAGATRHLDLGVRPGLLRGCGAAGVLGGALFVAWGYVDGPDLSEDFASVVRVLAFVVPALFLAVIVGLCVLWRSGLGKLGWLVVTLAAYALCWGLVGAHFGGEAVWVYFAQRGWPHFMSSWLLFMLVGLSILGVWAVRGGSARSHIPGSLVLATGAFGWPYYITNSGAVLEAHYWPHVGFGVLFGLGWMALGIGLLLAAGTGIASKGTAGAGLTS
jgi:hypothetical protein